jgi:SAM-dependent methyltransferase
MEQQNIHALSGRRSRPDMTAKANEAILRHLNFAPGDRVLDIGCGDASLLSSITIPVSAVGTVVSEAEREVLAANDALKNFSFRAASFDDLWNLPGPFNCIVANGCLHFAFTKEHGLRVLEDITKLLAPGGKLWLGELLAKRQAQPHLFSSTREAIRHVYRMHGLRFTLAFLRHLLKHRRRAGRIVEMPPRLWYVTRQEIPEIADRLGLKVEGIWTCEELTQEKFFTENRRFSVLLAK